MEHESNSSHMIEGQSEGGVRPQFEPSIASLDRDEDRELAEALTSAGDVLQQIAHVADSEAEVIKSHSQGLVRPLSAPATNHSEELNNIDFKKLIGGPLQAAVDAQIMSAIGTINFINQVGFITDGTGKRELAMADFTHTRKSVDDQGKETSEEVFLKVPLLSVVQVPSLRIEQVVIDFNVKLNSAERVAVSTELGVKAELAVGWGPVSFKVAGAYQRKTATDVEVKREYTMNVNVKAVQDEIPAGLERVLGVLAA